MHNIKKILPDLLSGLLGSFLSELLLWSFSDHHIFVDQAYLLGEIPAININIRLH